MSTAEKLLLKALRGHSVGVSGHPWSRSGAGPENAPVSLISWVRLGQVASLSLRFLICKTGIMSPSSPYIYCEDCI